MKFLKCFKSNAKYLSAAAAISASFARRTCEEIPTHKGLQPASARFGSEESKYEAVLEVMQKKSLR